MRSLNFFFSDPNNRDDRKTVIWKLVSYAAVLCLVTQHSSPKELWEVRGVTNQRTVAWETGGNRALRVEKIKMIDEQKLKIR